MSKIIGYVILTEMGDGFESAPDHAGDKPTLWLGNHLSLFKTKHEAQAILERTKKFAAKNSHDWPWLATAAIYPVKAAS